MIKDLEHYKPTLGQSWLLVALIFAGSLVAGFSLPNSAQSLTYAIMMLLPLAFCWWMGRQAAAAGVKALAIDRPHFGKLPAGVFFALAGIAMIASSILIEPAVTFIPMRDSIKAIFEQAFVNSALWDMILSTCILAPILEELICRGVMLRGMLTRMSPWKAIVWSAVLFAVMHLNLWQAIPAFMMGLLLGWIYWRTHSLWATIFLHFLNNSLSTIIARGWPDLPFDASLKDILNPTTYWTIYALAAVLLAATLYLLNEKTRPTEVQARVEG